MICWLFVFSAVGLFLGIEQLVKQLALKNHDPFFISIFRGFTAPLLTVVSIWPNNNVYIPPKEKKQFNHTHHTRNQDNKIITVKITIKVIIFVYDLYLYYWVKDTVNCRWKMCIAYFPFNGWMNLASSLVMSGRHDRRRVNEAHGLQEIESGVDSLLSILAVRLSITLNIKTNAHAIHTAIERCMEMNDD